MSPSKEDYRSKFAGCAPPQTFAGKIAERLRRKPEYRAAKTILMMPSPLLFQARINCLLDGKILLMPSPALKLGFFRVKPFSVGFPDLAYGTSLKGITLFGKKMSQKQLQKMEIDLALTGCIAIDNEGHRLGEGTGFFDLSMAILADHGAVTLKTGKGCVGGNEQISPDPLPCDPWDVALDFMLMADGELDYASQPTLAKIDWQPLAKKQIRKIEPLWQLYCEKFPVAPTDEPKVETPVHKTSPWDKAIARKKTTSS